MAANNVRIESQKFFNSQISKPQKAWADSAAAYFRQIGSTGKDNWAEAMAAYYAKVNAGTITAPVSPTSTQRLVTNGDTGLVTNSSNTAIASGTIVVAGGNITGIRLPAGYAGVAQGASVTVPITFTTARTAGQQATVAATFTVAAGVITAITIA